MFVQPRSDPDAAGKHDNRGGPGDPGRSFSGSRSAAINDGERSERDCRAHSRYPLREPCNVSMAEAKW
jgi:hypothetical protein